MTGINGVGVISNASIQSVVDTYSYNGFETVKIASAIYETYRDDPEFQNLLKMEDEAINLYFQVENLINDIRYHLNEIIRTSDDNLVKKKVDTIISEHERRIEEYSRLYREYQYRLDNLAGKFGYQFFNKKILTLD